ncbi:MAG: glycosyltransferase [Bacteroidetes bacterium]|nr:glycosyltransferase [Bacteroidota bacterium]
MKASISKLSIVVPPYNEAKTIHLLLDKVIEVNLLNNIVKEIIIVDDCSNDKTGKKIQEFHL